MGSSFSVKKTTCVGTNGWDAELTSVLKGKAKGNSLITKALNVGNRHEEEGQAREMKKKWVRDWCSDGANYFRHIEWEERRGQGWGARWWEQERCAFVGGGWEGRRNGREGWGTPPHRTAVLSLCPSLLEFYPTPPLLAPCNRQIGG